MGTEGHTSAVRVDQWVWAVRIFRTRALAAAACRAGHVHVNGRTARPATTVRVGDLVEARVEHRTFKLEVTRLIDKRVGPPAARTCFVDYSPPPEAREERPAQRDPGSGRPTKRDRRRLNQLRGR
jgi:ribosome-associated heat shock protein Hsp15